MDVAFVSNVVYPFVKGGAEKRIYELGRRLATDGHNVTIYGRHFWDGPARIDYAGMTLRAVAPETDLYTDGRRSIPEAIDFAARLLLPLDERLQAKDHDVVVVSVFPYFPVIASKLSTLGHDVPLITTWHEVWGSHWNEYLGHLAPFGNIVERFTARIPHYPVAVSGVTADRLARIGPPRDSIKIVPNGIDIQEINGAPLPRERGDEDYDVVFVGRLIQNKNVSLLLDAFDRLAGYHDVTLGIIGDGPELQNLQRQSNQLEHSDRVTFLGFVEESEVVLGYMRAADVFVSPSIREGFGITLLEAMAADCTVIAANHPESAAREVIGAAGFVVKPTLDALSSKLDRVLEGETPAQSPTERASQYDWDNVSTRAEATYQQAISGRWSSTSQD